MKLVITGGAGFVGANLVAELSTSRDDEITVVDNEISGDRRKLAAFPVHFVHGDVRDTSLLHEVLEGQDALIHLAADTRAVDSVANPAFNFDNNVVATFHLLDVARAKGVKQIVNASTGGAILGDVTPPVHEDLPARPLAPYGASKLAAEGYLHAFGAAYGLQTCSLRFSNVYGPRSEHKESVVAQFLKQLMTGQPLTVYGDGSQIRDYLYVMDLVRGIHRALAMGVQGVYQLGSGRPTTILQLIEVIRRVTGFDVSVRYRDFRAGEVYATYCDVRKARRDLGFEPATPLERGVAETWAWFRQTFPMTESLSGSTGSPGLSSHLR